MHFGGVPCPRGFGTRTVTRRTATAAQGYNAQLHRGCRPTAMWAAAEKYPSHLIWVVPA